MEMVNPLFLLFWGCTLWVSVGERMLSAEVLLWPSNPWLFSEFTSKKTSVNIALQNFVFGGFRFVLFFHSSNFHTLSFTHAHKHM